MPFKMTLPKFSGLTYLLFILIACNQTSKQSDHFKSANTTQVDTNKMVISSTKTTDTTSISNEDIENNIVDTIFKLPEIKERAKYIEEQTKGKRHLKVWVADTPNFPDQKYYWIKAGEDNGRNLVTHFNFYVYPDSMRIMYYDTQSDSELTLEEWRKTKNGM